MQSLAVVGNSRARRVLDRQAAVPKVLATLLFSVKEIQVLLFAVIIGAACCCWYSCHWFGLLSLVVSL